MPLPLRHLLRKRRYGGGSARHIESGIPQIYSRTSDRFRRIFLLAAHLGEGRFNQSTAATQAWRREPLFMPEAVEKRVM